MSPSFTPEPAAANLTPVVGQDLLHDLKGRDTIAKGKRDTSAALESHPDPARAL